MCVCVIDESTTDLSINSLKIKKRRARVVCVYLNSNVYKNFSIYLKSNLKWMFRAKNYVTFSKICWLL